MKSVMQHSFAQIPNTKKPRSQFNRSFGRKSTFDAGYLVPVLWDLALPGDTLNCHMSSFARLATPIVPFMDNLYLDSFFFAIPMRLVWDNFQKFMGEQTNPDDSVDYTIPQMVAPAGTGHAIGSLSDYLGLPTGIPGISHSCLWHRAYTLTWNEWFRDENMQDSQPVPTDNGPDLYTEHPLQRANKRHDYFTACLPWPQKGEAITMPLGTEAPIRGKLDDGTIDDKIHIASGSGLQGHYLTSTGTTNVSINSSIGGADLIQWQQPGAATSGVEGYNYADLSNATAATINALRQAFQIQALLEQDARSGTRYTEIIRGHFGVISPDARLQRPEYLGGGTSRINIHPIAQTSSTDVTTPQGNLAAMGTASTSGHGFVKSFTEHCLILGMVRVRADLNYQQGINRLMSWETKYDFYWPALAQIGEQAVLNKEIYAQGTGHETADETAFGYQERYAECRYKPSEITGLFRSTAAGTLDKWHLAQKFTSLPTLDSTFIQENPPIDRVVAVTSQPDMLFDAYFNYIAARPMPMYGVPFQMSRF